MRQVSGKATRCRHFENAVQAPGAERFPFPEDQPGRDWKRHFDMLGNTESRLDNCIERADTQRLKPENGLRRFFRYNKD